MLSFPFWLRGRALALSGSNEKRGRNESDCLFYIDDADNHDDRRAGTRVHAKS
jgi:hypothetical protein